ncbi:MAG: ATP synthase F0 subunit B [Clostridia bacterium]|nr:ATP synthase F0 subunit B [Clostridia bacterium]
MNLPLNIDILQILLHMLNFVILAGGLTFLLYKPVVKFMEERRRQFAEQEAENKAKAEENEKLREEYEKKIRLADAEISERKKLLEKEYADISAEYIRDAKEKATAIINAAELEAEDRKEHILESVQAEIGELVVSATQKLLNETDTPERNSALYDEFIRLAENNVNQESLNNDKK